MCLIVPNVSFMQFPVDKHCSSDFRLLSRFKNQCNLTFGAPRDNHYDALLDLLTYNQAWAIIANYSHYFVAPLSRTPLLL